MSVETAGWPRAEAVVRDDGSGQVTINGQMVPVYQNSLGEARTEVMRLITEYSTNVGLAVEVRAEGPEGLTGLTVYPDGRVVQDGGAGAAHAAQAKMTPPSLPTPVVPAQRPAHLARPMSGQVPGPMSGQLPHLVAGPVSMSMPVVVPPERPPAGPASPAEPRRSSVMGRGGAPSAPFGQPAQSQDSPFGDPGPDGARRDSRRSSFVTKDRLDEPATQGFRGVLSRIGFRVRPNEAERAERADEQMVSQHWPGPRTISIVNGKGGAGKTPATVLLSAVFSSHGGSGVVAWDNNQTRGTLGWRTEQGPHESTLLDLIPQTEHFLGPAAQLADLAWFVHHQSRDRFDVLRSKPMALAHEQRISSEDVDAIHAVLAKYYRMIFIDSGNDESDPMWLRMIDHTDQLVVATSTRDDHAEAGALLLEALSNRGEHMAELARKAVVVVSQSDPKATPADMRRVAQGYRSLAREVVTIPFDPAMVDGQLVYRSLRPLTRRAWLAAGAAVARGF
ncbi:ATPase [Promicromonospora panici]|uniref:ATPase n=1 Tax=Promicromonospora panici TaxID=2219658 RepID=UPI00101C125D|nr:ATPase [Promicromonospora panici]